MKKNFHIEREISNYIAINHPLLHIFYGNTRSENHVIIEYINGKTLSQIKNLNFNESDIFTICFQLLIIIEFIHRNHCVYQDLKPDNVMIDENKNIVLIDLDRMLQIQNSLNDKSRTLDFNSDFTVPEVNSGNFSDK